MTKNGGWTVEVREHSLSFDVYLLLKVVICDSTTTKKINTKRLAETIIRQMHHSYQITYFKKVVEGITVKSGLDNYQNIKFARSINKAVRVHCSVKYRIINTAQQRHNDEILVDVRDQKMLIGNYGKVNHIGGTNLYLSEVYLANMLNGRDNNTIPHELGHTLGLHHVDDFGTRFSSPRESWNNEKRNANRTNVMFSGNGGYINDKTSTTVIPEQINLIIERYKNGNLNLR